MDRATWEARYGFIADTLAYGEFSTGAMPAASAPQVEAESTEFEAATEATTPVDQGPVVITVPEQPDYVIPTETEG
jgi:hypothetical protein